MCGIFAVASEQSVPSNRELTDALNSMRHRGPDGMGLWVCDSDAVALGHVRRSIIDLAGGQQPIQNEDGSIRASVHGEFYDFEAIRKKLEQSGHSFRTKSDSEILVHLYEDCGIEAIDQLNGEFAFVLWDNRKKLLWAVRDRFGTKPLFYSRKGLTFLVGTEIQALSKLGLEMKWNLDAVSDQLLIPAATMQQPFESVESLPPAHWMCWKGGEIKKSRYWLQEKGTRSKVLPVSFSESISSLLTKAVETRTVADVPIGCYLSGGLDSSTVYSIACRYLGRRIPAFTVQFDEANKAEVDRAVLVSSGDNLEIIDATERNRAAVFEETVSAAEAIILNGHAPARFLLSKAVAAAGLRVTLGGEGADEVFGGYWFLNGAVGKSSGLLKNIISASMEGFQSNLWSVSPILWLISRGVGLSTKVGKTLGERQEILSDIGAPIFAGRRKDPVLKFLRDVRWWSELRRQQPIRQLLGLWLRSVFCNYNLAAERLDMAHAVEVRLPFLDLNVWDALAHQNANAFMDGKKSLLRRIAAPLLPKAIVEAPKEPFIAPFTSTKGAMMELFGDLLTGSARTAVPFVDARKTENWINKLRSKYVLTLSEESLLYSISSLVVLQKRFSLK